MIDIVIPTIGRPSLGLLLKSLARSTGPRPANIFVIDDRPDTTNPLALECGDDSISRHIRRAMSGGRGPAAARNAGWHVSRADWVCFLDDDVIVTGDWLERLHVDLAGLALDVAASMGRVHVPLPVQRKPTDWERNVAALETAQWITADAAYRRSELLASGGFDERFPRAYREDADLGLRIVARGMQIVSGTRTVHHPVRPASWNVSLRMQAGNADDALMRALHGSAWRARAGASPGAWRSHVVSVAAAFAALTALGARQPLPAKIAAVLWAAATLRFTWSRIAPGPRSPDEVVAMLATSPLIPFLAVYHHVRGHFLTKKLLADRNRAPHPLPAAVLFDRDGTLVYDVPYNADPERVRAVEGARDALQRLRAAGIPTAIVSNQSGIGLGLIERRDVDRVNTEIERQLGSLGPIFVCEHAPGAGCSCRKPAPGLIHAAAAALGVRARDCVVIGDIGADVKAAQAAGARAILVPTPVTLANEVRSAPLTAPTIGAAVDTLLSGAA